MSRLPNAYLIPTAVCIGIHLQRALAGIALFVTYRSKWQSQFYFLNAIALVFNIYAVLMGVVQIDFLNSPFATYRGYAFVLIFWGAVPSNVAGLILLYVLLARLYVFDKVTMMD
jgi:hypothetical protein